MIDFDFRFFMLNCANPSYPNTNWFFSNILWFIAQYILINCVPKLTFKLTIAFISVAIDNLKIG